MKIRRNKRIERMEFGYELGQIEFLQGCSQMCVCYEVQHNSSSYDVVFWHQEHDHFCQAGCCVWDNDEGEYCGAYEPPTWQFSVAWPMNEYALKQLAKSIIREIDEYKEAETEAEPLQDLMIGDELPEFLKKMIDEDQENTEE